MHPITFGITTGGDGDDRINRIIDSIENMHVRPPAYEVIIVGHTSSTINRAHTRHLAFDESIRPMWITKKKNMMTDNAAYDHIVYMHDYHEFDPNWYINLCAFGWDWDVQMHQILMQNGYRMFDWLTYDHPTAPCHTPIPYHRTDLIPYQYISGGYWIGRKAAMQEERQNDDLVWGQAEDIDWTYRIRNKFKITMNPACIVRHNKPHRENEPQKHRMLTLNTYFS